MNDDPAIHKVKAATEGMHGSVYTHLYASNQNEIYSVK